MPKLPLRPCRKCRRATNSDYCPKCKAEIGQQTKQYDRQRGSSAKRGYGSKWDKARRSYLQDHPLCVECLKHGQLTQASVVDHITPHKGDMILFWDQSNWQSLCANCHGVKTATEDGGFGNKVSDKLRNQCDERGLPTDSGHYRNK